jgi:polysaccharide export outer membrane protein
MGQTTVCQPMRLGLAALLAAVVLCWTVGCASPLLYRYDMYVDQPVPAGIEPAREKAMVSLPAYRIEPPDLLQIEALKLVPRPPYRIEVFDVLQIQATGTLFDQPIAGYYLVEGQGTVDLGPAYGKLRVAGMTIDEANAAIEARLREILVRPQVSVQLARTSGVQPVTGVYLVAPDGTVNLRSYGVVRLAGMTVVEAREALQEHLSQFFDSPEVSVDVAGYNSKVYYIVTEGANLGDNIVRVPVTGNETVLDAIAQVGGLSQLSSKQLWIARPAPGDFAMEQILPIDYEAITRGGSSASNYQLMPGDRLFISEDGIVSFNNFLAKLIAPAERLLGVSSLGSSAARNFQTLGRQYNKQRGF